MDACRMSLFLVVTLLGLSFVHSQPCHGSCQPPDCSCPRFKYPMDTKDIPQMVYFGFDDAVNVVMSSLYKRIFTPKRVNPNGCRVPMTLFVSHQYTDYKRVKQFYDEGHEIASHSVTHSNIDDAEILRKEAKQQKENLVKAGVPEQEITGWRSPFLKTAGDIQPKILQELGYEYDISLTYSRPSMTVPKPWPFTINNGWPYRCGIEPCPTRARVEKFWEVPVVSMMDYKNSYPCSYVDGCAIRANNENEAFDFLMNNFRSYYNTSRAPFGLNMHAAWFYTRYNLKAMMRFLDELQKLPDVYVVTVKQMLDWMKHPTPISEIDNFRSWQCDASRKKMAATKKITAKPTTITTTTTTTTTPRPTTTTTTTRRPTTTPTTTTTTTTRPTTTTTTTRRPTTTPTTTTTTTTRPTTTTTTPRPTTTTTTTKRPTTTPTTTTTTTTTTPRPTTTTTTPRPTTTTTTTKRPTTTTTTTAKPTTTTRRPTTTTTTKATTTTTTKSTTTTSTKPTTPSVTAKPTPRRTWWNFWTTLQTSTVSRTCKPNINCRLPDCFCQGDQIPNSLKPEDTPQMVYITINGNVNPSVYRRYRQIFRDFKNSNGCPARGTVFVSEKGTYPFVMRRIQHVGAEVAMRGLHEHHYETSDQLEQEIIQQKDAMTRNRIKAIRGWKTPEMKALGNDQFKLLSKYGFDYDATVTSSLPKQGDNNPWPYTLDFGHKGKCVIPKCPTDSFPGLWEVPGTALLDYKKMFQCFYADGCMYNPPFANSTFNFLLDNFNANYKTNRAPFGINLRQVWFEHPAFIPNLRGLLYFVAYLRTLPDVYLVSASDVIDWMKDPTPLDKITSSKPWKC